MFDIDDFVARCVEAIGESEPRGAVKEVLQRALADAGDVADALPAERGELRPLYVSDELTVVKVVWAPGMRFRPHNHLMWAAIGLYGGQEDNVFYRDTPDGLVVSGCRQLRTGDVALLGDDVIHAVVNPRRTYTGAIHVYGGNITATPGRSEWDDDSGQELPYDFVRTQEYFATYPAPAVA